MENQTDTNVVFSCESYAYPIPNIEWRFISTRESSEPDDKAIQLKYLPADDPRVIVQSRGGPGSYEVLDLRFNLYRIIRQLLIILNFSKGDKLATNSKNSSFGFRLLPLCCFEFGR